MQIFIFPDIVRSEMTALDFEPGIDFQGQILERTTKRHASNTERCYVTIAPQWKQNIKSISEFGEPRKYFTPVMTNTVCSLQCVQRKL